MPVSHSLHWPVRFTVVGVHTQTLLPTCNYSLGPHFLTVVFTIDTFVFVIVFVVFVVFVVFGLREIEVLLLIGLRGTKVLLMVVVVVITVVVVVVFVINVLFVALAVVLNDILVTLSRNAGLMHVAYAYTNTKPGGH